MKITVYSTTTCPYCVQLKQWLTKKEVEFTDYMIDKNPYAAQMMIIQSVICKKTRRQEAY